MEESGDLVRPLLVELMLSRLETEDKKVQERIDKVIVILNAETVIIDDLQRLVSQGLVSILTTLRPICWRINFGILGNKKIDWKIQLVSTLKTYSTYVRTLFEQSKSTTNDDHPLSNKRESKWHMFFQDTLLWDRIEQDCLRTKQVVFKRSLANPNNYRHSQAGGGILTTETIQMKMT